MTSPFSYEGKRVVVTGGFSGVGAALVELLTELGAEHITVLDIKEPTGSAQKFIQTDLNDAASIDAAIAEITADGPVHALFNNAGVAGTLPAPVVFGINYLGLRRLTEALVENGTLSSGAAIVNTASIAGFGWAPHLEDIKALIAIDGWDEAQAELASREVDAYSYSKEIVQVYTMHYARTAAGKGLRVNSICPSPIDTPLLPDFRKTMSDKVIDWNVSQGNGRLATGRDVALGLAFLGADASAFINGVNINLDGGFNAGLTVGNLDFSGLA
ncbi:SDR family oxidoreductase [Yinghuangia seranimata]|uniref:SDR family oxidoreductase n=1 Tax=Yinghuangia seranimata TaxID=408067 RepID=UPI00248BCB40|nr:SDR family oxidoreductase [Yinghuangia seranimata]MDI2125233.1 SDR family oxidoreductase [Yinghuangia seranimata]